jgi:transmembrane sensor
VETNDYIRIFRKFQNHQASRDEIWALINWLDDRTSFDSWANKEWADAPVDIDRELQNKIYERIQQKIGATTKRMEPQKRSWSHKLYVRFAQVAAVLALLFLIGFGYHWYKGQQEWSSTMNTIAANGQNTQFTLPDGSKVWLSSRSSLQYPNQFNGNLRKVILNGEAYFEVEHNAQKPFIVSTKDINVRVTGTKFDVVAYPQEHSTEVILASGSVNVYLSGKDESTAKKLRPNQMYTLANNHTESVQEVDACQFTSWTKGVYDYNNETLQEISKRLERYYGAQIICSPDVAQLRSSGEIDLQENISTAMNDLEMILSVKCQVKNGVYYLSK